MANTCVISIFLKGLATADTRLELADDQRDRRGGLCRFANADESVRRPRSRRDDRDGGTAGRARARRWQERRA